MDSGILEAVLNFASTVAGSAFVCFTGVRLIAYRLEQLEKKVDKHNNVIERTFIMEENIKEVNRRLDNLERKMDEVEKEV